MSALWRAYMRALTNHPFKTQTATTAVLACTGDALAQLAVERKGSDYDVRRGFRFFLVGLVFIGPSLRFWYLNLDKLYKGSSKSTALKKMLTDQLLFAPVFLTTYLSVLGVTRGDSMQAIKEKVQRDFKPVIITNYKIWPAVQLANFYFFPLHHRILIVNVVAVGWNTFLAWKVEETLDVVVDSEGIAPLNPSEETVIK